MASSLKSIQLIGSALRNTPRSTLYTTLGYNTHSTLVYNSNNNNISIKRWYSSSNNNTTSNTTATTTQQPPAFVNSIEELSKDPRLDLVRGMKFGNLSDEVFQLVSIMSEEEKNKVFPPFEFERPSNQIDEAHTLDWYNEHIQQSIEKKQFKDINPYDQLWEPVSSPFTYYRLKLSQWRDIMPLNRPKLSVRLVSEFKKLYSAVERGDRDTLNSEYFTTQSQFALEMSRDVFSTLRNYKDADGNPIKYEFIMKDVKVVLLKNKIDMPYTTVQAHFFVTGSFNVPQSGEKPTTKSYYIPIFWSAKLPWSPLKDHTEEQIDFDATLQWRPTFIPLVGKIMEIGLKKQNEYIEYQHKYYQNVVDNFTQVLEQKFGKLPPTQSK